MARHVRRPRDSDDARVVAKTHFPGEGYRSREGHGFLYLLLDPHLQIYKVGHTSDLFNRACCIGHNIPKLKFVFVFEGGAGMVKRVETMLLALFEEQRTTHPTTSDGMTEWLSLPPEVVEATRQFLCRNKSVNWRLVYPAQAIT